MRYNPATSRTSLISAFVLPPLLLWGGWFWARTAVSRFQSQVGMIDLQTTPLASHYHFLGITLPHYVTLAAVILVLIPSALVLFRRRLLFVGLCFYALLLAFISMFVFVGFEFEAFN